MVEWRKEESLFQDEESHEFRLPGGPSSYHCTFSILERCPDSLPGVHWRLGSFVSYLDAE
jgi:hypothetical protein